MLLEIILVAVLVIAFIAEVVLTETEHFGWATALLILCGAASYYFNVYGAALWVKAHVAETLIFVGIYIVAGVVWSFIKWFSYLIKYREQWQQAKNEDEDYKAEWISKAKIRLTRLVPEQVDGTIPQNDEEWDAYYKKHDRVSYRTEMASRFSKPLASDNKAKITAWMAFWPFSFLGTFINDPIRRLFNFIFSNFKKLYQQMSDHLFKDLEPKDENNRD